MTEEQAAKIIALLESIDKRLESVIDGAEDSVNVNVQGEVYVANDSGTPLAVYTLRS